MLVLGFKGFFHEIIKVLSLHIFAENVFSSVFPIGNDVGVITVKGSGSGRLGTLSSETTYIHPKVSPVHLKSITETKIRSLLTF